MVFYLAKNKMMAQTYAKKDGYSPNEWKLLTDAAQLYGIKRGTAIIVCLGTYATYECKDALLRDVEEVAKARNFLILK